MDYSDIFISSYWATLKGLVPLFVPFIAVLLVIRLVAAILFNRGR